MAKVKVKSGRRVGPTSPTPAPALYLFNYRILLFFFLFFFGIKQHVNAQKKNSVHSEWGQVSAPMDPSTPIVLLYQGFFFMSSGAEIRPLSQWDLGDFFPNLKKNPNLKKKKKKNFFFFFFRIFIQSPHKLHDDNLLELHPIFLQFNGNSMCNS